MNNIGWLSRSQEMRGHQGSPEPYFRNIRKLAIVLALLPLTAVLTPVSATNAAAARTMTVEEYQFALTIFEREFPPRDQITITDQTGLGGAFFVRPTVGELVPGKKGYIRMNLGRMFANPLSPENRSTFVHELTHAWQIEHFELAWYLREATSNQVLSSDAYSYVCDPAKKLSDYNAEQQAEVVRNAFEGNDCARSVSRALRSDTWKLSIGSDALDVTVSETGKPYMVNTAGLMYTYVDTNWEQLSGSAGRSIAANAGQVWMVNSGGSIYSFANNTWTKARGSDGRDIAVDSDGKVWMVNSAGLIYTARGGSKWERMPGSSALRIAAGGGQVWMTNTAGLIYKFAGGQWTQMPGSAAKDIAVSNDGAVFLTNRLGLIYQWNGSAWNQLDGSDGSTVAANKNALLLANTKGRMFTRKY